MVLRLLFLALIWIFAGMHVYADTTAPDTLFKPNVRPLLEVSRAPGKIDVDGDLSDPGWQAARPAGNFTEHGPGEEVRPPVRTEAFITYDNDFLYIAAVCYADPAQVRASWCERENIFNDDNIGFFFDPFGEAARAYIINLNPFGIPYDALWTPNYGEDQNFNLVFESAGLITDSGYQVEAAIPFSGLRFPNRPVQTWRFEFYRHHQREVHYAMSWAGYDQNEVCWPCQWGTVEGIENVQPGRGLELLPSLVAHQSAQAADEVYPRESFENGDIFGDLSLGGRYAITSDLSVEATYNPDFSQIEADASQVDVNSTFALNYPERRPFFQESMDLFGTNFMAVYTRAINDPEFAAKVTGRIGATSVAALSAQDEHSPVVIPLEERSVEMLLGKSYTNMVAVHRALGQDNHARLLITDRRYDGGGSGTLASLDLGWRLNRSLKVRGQVMATHTEEPDTDVVPDDLDGVRFDNGRYSAALDGESYTGSAALLGLVYDSRKLYANVRGYQRAPTYRAESGLQPRNNDRHLEANVDYHIRIPEGAIYRIDPGVEVARIWNFNGEQKDEWAEVHVGTMFRFAQAEAWTTFITSRERLAGRYFRGIWAADLSFSSRPSHLVSLGGSATYGRMIARNIPDLGMQTSLSAWVNLQLTGRMRLETDAITTRNRDVETDEEYFSGYIVRSRLGYQISREFSLRLVGEYNDFRKQWSVDPLITYRINPFSTFYLGATYDYERFDNTGILKDCTITCLARRQFFMKIQYLFQT